MTFEDQTRWDVETPVALTCRSCGTAYHYKLEDGWCDSCNGVDTSAEDAARRREAIRALHVSTALMLRKLGFAERAAVHDAEAER